MSEHIDLLRIIAKDGGRLNVADRVALAEAASEFERVQHELEAVRTALLAANAHRAALAEQVSEDRRKKYAQSLTMSTGWVTIPLVGWGG